MFKFHRIFKIYILFGVFAYFFTSFVFAASSDNSSFAWIFVSVVDLLLSIWFIFPIIAWKLLTNDLIYGSVFHLDTMLWQIWNFSRSLANFTIWFMFLYFVFKFLVKVWESDYSIIKSNLPKIALWAVVINASWFILWVLIDISTILISWFWALPLKFYNEDTKEKIDKIALPKDIVLQQWKCKKNPESWIKQHCLPWSLQIEIKEQQSQSLRSLQTYWANVSWPLFFMWSSIIAINDKQKLINDFYDVNEWRIRSGWAAIKAFAKLMIMTLFIIPMLILIVVNIVRVFRVWMYICFSPLMFLDQIFWWKVASKAKQRAFSFKNMIWLIFQPALVVLMFSISSIFIVWVYNALKTSEWDSKWYEEDVKKVFMLDKSDNWILEISFWEPYSDSNSSWYVWWFFSYVLVSVLVIFVVWSMIKLSFKATEVTSSIANSAFTFAEDTVKTTSFIPTPMWGVSIWALWRLGKSIESIPSNISGKQLSRLSGAFWWSASDIQSDKFESIKNKLSDSNAKISKDWIQDALDEISKYKWMNIDSFENVKSLVDSITTYVINKRKHVPDIKDPSYTKRVDSILANRNEILN